MYRFELIFPFSLFNWRFHCLLPNYRNKRWWNQSVEVWLSLAINMFELLVEWFVTYNRQFLSMFLSNLILISLPIVANRNVCTILPKALSFGLRESVLNSLRRILHWYSPSTRRLETLRLQKLGLILNNFVKCVKPFETRFCWCSRLIPVFSLPSSLLSAECLKSGKRVVSHSIWCTFYLERVEFFETSARFLSFKGWYFCFPTSFLILDQQSTLIQ